MIEDIILGTYTRSDSKGIYKIKLDTEKKKLFGLGEVASLQNPTYLDTTFDHSRLYAIAAKENQGGVKSFMVDEEGLYYPVDDLYFDGSAPCYLSLDEKRNLIYTANYHQGTVSVYRTNGQGKLELIDSKKHSGRSVHENQKSPHAHYFARTPDEKFVIACDLGTDEVITYKVSDQGQISHQATLKVKGGFGPRHLVFHPNAKTAYVFGELSNEISVLDYNLTDGTFVVKQTISTLPEAFKGENSGAAIRISKDGKFLYASNRGHHSIVTYSINENDELTLVSHTKTMGEGPRDFNLSNEDQFIVVGHQKTPNLTLFERDPVKGTLSLLQADVYAPEVVNVHFL